MNNAEEFYNAVLATNTELEKIIKRLVYMLMENRKVNENTVFLKTPLIPSIVTMVLMISPITLITLDFLIQSISTTY